MKKGRKTAKNRPVLKYKKTQRAKLRGGRRLSMDVIPKAACHPTVFHKRQGVAQDTCITDGLLKKLVEHHNNKHDHKIHSISHSEALKHLRDENTQCQRAQNKDECLLKNAGVPQGELAQVFAPKHDWKTPNEWLSNIDIGEVMKQHHQAFPEFHFFGPVPIDFNEPDVCRRSGDNLCNFNLRRELKQGKTKFGFIFNLDFEKGPGTHWVSMYYDANPKEPLLFYFDSGGKNNTPNDRFVHIDTLAKSIIYQAKQIPSHKFNPPVLEYNTTRHQSGNTECGVYSLFFIVTMLTRKLDFTKPELLSNDELRTLFHGKDGIITDEQMKHFRRVFFSGGRHMD